MCRDCQATKVERLNLCKYCVAKLVTNQIGPYSSIVSNSNVLNVANRQTIPPEIKLLKGPQNFKESKKMYLVEANLQIFLPINFSRKDFSSIQNN